MTEAPLYLNVSAIRTRTRVNGPGLRVAVWVQGCTLRCPGCFNPSTHPHRKRELFDPVRLMDHLASDPSIEGLSLLGGEPFEQAAACALLARRARERGLSVVTYSGYTARFLQSSPLPEVQSLLAATDLLIAGPYVAKRTNDGRGWHGSTNQELVFLTDRYESSVRDAFTTLPVVEARTNGLDLDLTGIPAPGDLRILHSDLLMTSAPEASASSVPGAHRVGPRTATPLAESPP